MESNVLSPYIASALWSLSNKQVARLNDSLGTLTSNAQVLAHRGAATSTHRGARESPGARSPAGSHLPLHSVSHRAMCFREILSEEFFHVKVLTGSDNKTYIIYVFLLKLMKKLYFKLGPKEKAIDIMTTLTLQGMLLKECYFGKLSRIIIMFPLC